MMIDKNTYFEMSLEYPGGHREQIISRDIHIDRGFSEQDYELRDYDRLHRNRYVPPKITELKYRNLWGVIVIMKLPDTVTIHYSPFIGDVWWIEEDGKRVSPIMDKSDDVFDERIKYPNGTVIVKTFKKGKEEE